MSVVPSHAHEVQSWVKATGRPLPTDHSGFYVIGCDEAGRGPLAGPVVAAACCVWVPLIQNTSTPVAEITATIPGLAPLRDSKVINEVVRGGIFNCLKSGVSSSSNDHVSTDADPYFTNPSILESLKKLVGEDAVSDSTLRSLVRGEMPTPTCFKCTQGDDATGDALLSRPYVHSYSFRLVSSEEIDKLNILHASLLGMMECATVLLEGLDKSLVEKGGGGSSTSTRPPVIILIDGPHMPLELVELYSAHLPPPPAAVKKTPKAPKGKKKAGSKRSREEDAEVVEEDEVPVPAPPAPKVVIAHPFDLPFNSKPIPHYSEVLARRLKANPHLMVVTESEGTATTTRSTTAALDRLMWLGHGEDSKEDGDVIRGFNNAAALPVIKGDGLCPSIALASVVAKEVRDGFMINVLGKLVDGRKGVMGLEVTEGGGAKKNTAAAAHYGFAEHKGYPVPQHMSAVKQHGAIRGLHRFSFAPVAATVPPPPKKGGSSEPALLSTDDFVDALLKC